jgi:RNA polymerase sigma-70 factor (ECF subfamily)
MRRDKPATGSSEDLMLRYARGDLEAFHSLYNRHRAGLYRYFLRQTGPGMADELFQEVWARVIKSRGRYRPSAGFRTWLYTLARNRLIDHWRAQGRLPKMDANIDDDVLLNERARARLGPAQLADLRDCIEHLMSQVAMLPDAQRETFLLRHEAGLSLAQIGEAMKTGTETARSRLRYAMDRLRMNMPEECLEET